MWGGRSPAPRGALDVPVARHGGPQTGVSSVLSPLPPRSMSHRVAGHEGLVAVVLSFSCGASVPERHIEQLPLLGRRAQNLSPSSRISSIVNAVEPPRLELFGDDDR